MGVPCPMSHREGRQSSARGGWPALSQAAVLSSAGQFGANSLGAASPPCVPLASCWLWPILFMIYHSRALTCEGDARDRSRQGSVTPEGCACVRARCRGGRAISPGACCPARLSRPGVVSGIPHHPPLSHAGHSTGTAAEKDEGRPREAARSHSPESCPRSPAALLRRSAACWVL